MRATSRRNRSSSSQNLKRNPYDQTNAGLSMVVLGPLLLMMVRPVGAALCGVFRRRSGNCQLAPGLLLINSSGPARAEIDFLTLPPFGGPLQVPVVDT